MSDVAFVVCSNGMGHFKRAVSVANRVLELTEGIRVSLCCAPWQAQGASEWKPFAAFRKHPRTTLRPFDSQMGWHTDPAVYEDCMLDSRQALQSLDLAHYDLVVSDNLVEPLRHAKRGMLMGSFLWHDVLVRAYPAHEVITRYAGETEAYLEETRPVMIASKLFAMPAVTASTRTMSIGLSPHWSFPKHGATRTDRTKRALVATGWAHLGHLARSRILQATATLAEVGFQLHADPGTIEELAGMDLDAVLFSFDTDALARMDIAIVRGGLGTISNCVAAGVPMLAVPDENPEIKHNVETLSRLGWGDKFSQNESPWWENDQVLAELRENTTGVDISGEEQAGRLLTEILSVDSPETE